MSDARKKKPTSTAAAATTLFFRSLSSPIPKLFAAPSPLRISRTIQSSISVVTPSFRGAGGLSRCNASRNIHTLVAPSSGSPAPALLWAA